MTTATMIDLSRFSNKVSEDAFKELGREANQLKTGRLSIRDDNKDISIIIDGYLRAYSTLDDHGQRHYYFPRHAMKLPDEYK